jgi:general secretion pathway protein D
VKLWLHEILKCFSLDINLNLHMGLLLAVLVLSGCNSVQVEPLPEPLRPPRDSSGGAVALEELERTEKESSKKTEFIQTPKVEITKTQAQGLEDRLGRDLRGDPVTVSFNDVPLPVFINEVFGNELGMSFLISPGLRNKTDLVTLRLTEALAPAALFATSRTVLAQYGVDIQEAEGILTFVLSDESPGKGVPLLISGRTLVNVPPSHRIIFQMVPLKVTQNSAVTGWLKQAFKGHDMIISEDAERNAVVLRGTPEMIAQAVEMIDVLDQPLLKGKNSLIIKPVYAKVKTLAKELDKILRAEGYQVRVGGTGGAVILLPLEDANKLLVFAEGKKTLAHIQDWVRILDEQRQNTIQEAIFTYEVQNTQAKDLQETLNAILGMGGETQGRPENSSVQSVGSQQSGIRGGQGGVVVDQNRNMIIYRGSGKDWGEMLKVLQKLDKPVPSVLIEVLLAEVTLSDAQGSGFEFLFNGKADRKTTSGGTLGALGVSSKGLSMVLDSAGATRAVLNLFSENSKVVIRSNPKLLVKSGETATIEVGNEIPLITQNELDQSTNGGTSNILQQISYRKTGVIMEIEPVVQANGLVDLRIAQELSEARPTASTSLNGSPTILNRKVETSLTLRDGGSLLMGGIITNSQSSGRNGVPGLDRIPVFGRLFRSDNFQQDRTELIIMVIPYVVADHKEGWELTDKFKKQLELQNL